MSSSEEYLDSLLESILGGNNAEEEKASSEQNVENASEESRSAEAGKAMSPEEIEEMLVSMGTLDGEVSDAPATEETAVEDMSLFDFSLEGTGIEESIEADLGLEESTEADLGLEEGIEADLGLEGFAEGDLLLDGMTMDELSLDGLSMEETGIEESIEADLGLEGFAEGDLSLDGMTMDELSLDGLSMEETGIEESIEADLGLEESIEADLGLEESIEADLGLEESIETDLGLEELPEEEAALDDMSLDDLTLDGLGGEESGESDLALEELDVDADMDGLMSEEDIDRLLNGESMEAETASEDFALEETGEGEDDLAQLLAGMDHDEDLSEINDLLEESQEVVSADDDLLAMLEDTSDGDDGSFDFFESDEAAREAEGIRELSPEEVAARENNGKEKPKKKKKKLFGKKKSDAEEAEGGLEGTDGQETEKKPGFLAKLMDILLESDEEDPLAAEILGDNGGATGTISDENKELLDELNAEDKKGKKKKKKEKKKEKEKKKKEKEEDEETEKKPKKPKKEKKKKQISEEDLLAPPEKKLSKKKVITVFLFCGTIAVCIILATSLVPAYLQVQEAHVAYESNEYEKVYDLLYAKERDEQDEILFQRSNLILQMRRKVNSYQNYVNLDMRLEALNALISGVERYQQVLPKAENYNVVDEVNDIYSQILGLLSADFGVSEAEALEIIALKDDVAYTQWLEGILEGSVYDEYEDEPVEAALDILPEEEEILERLEGLEGAQQGEEIVIDDVTPENWDEGSEE